MFFQHAFGNVIFFNFLYQKFNFCGPTWAPTWRQKLTNFHNFRVRSPKSPMGTPKTTQSLPWTLPGASESLQNQFLDIENLHFSTPRLLKTQKKYKKTSVFATHPESAKITTKSIDSEHFRADPGKIYFLDP